MIRVLGRPNDAEHITKARAHLENESPSLDGLCTEIMKEEMDITLRVFPFPAPSSNVMDVTPNPNVTPNTDTGIPSPGCACGSNTKLSPRAEPEQECGGWWRLCTSAGR